VPTTDEVLDQIDSAVHDWQVSPDAMRSTPAPRPTPEELQAAARAFSEAVVRAYAQAVRPALEALTKAFAEVHRALQEAAALDEDCRPVRRVDRPAWQSPYGPPPRRHR
jgi:hypothetical protein